MIRERRLNFEVLTLFPGILEGPLNESILKRGQEKGLLTVTIRNIRDYAEDKHKTADDSPYGGGAGMVLKPEPIFKAFEAMKAGHPGEEFHTILLSPQGRLLTHPRAEQLSREKRRIVLLCGHYEAIDERVIDALVDEELSIGDYVLTGGELAALVVIDAAARLLPGVLGDEESAYRDSRPSALHAAGRLPRQEGPGGAPLREPRGDREVAAAGGAQGHAQKEAGAA